MVNVTISVTEELKTRMDEHAEVNWSKICREAIDTCIRTLENPIPQVEMTLKEVECNYKMGKPGLRLTLHFRNNMKTAIMLDRILYEINFIPTPGTMLSVGSGVYLHKQSFAAGSACEINPFMEIDAYTFFRIDQNITHTFRCDIELVSFFEGFRRPYVARLQAQIPLDFWRRFVKLVMKNERESLETRNKMMRKIE